MIEPGRVAGLAGGSYYYHPRDHRLAQISGRTVAPLGETAKPAAFSVILVGELAAIEPTYGALAAPFCAIEAGCMIELLENAAPSVDLGLGTVCDIVAVEPLALGPSHLLLGCLAGGRIAADSARQAAIVAARSRRAASPAPSTGERAEIRAHLRRRLPPYMVPANVFLLDALPLSANGKVDRAALPDPEAASAPNSGPTILPRTELENLLASLFMEVLAVPRVGIHDSFFDLGGNSIHLVRVHGRLQQTLSIEVPLLEMFNHPTVALLARFLEQPAIADGAPAELSSDRMERLRTGGEMLRRQLSQRRQAESMDHDQ